MLRQWQWALALLDEMRYSAEGEWIGGPWGKGAVCSMRLVRSEVTEFDPRELDQNI